jgi:glycosyltransferase-like protein
MLSVGIYTYSTKPRGSVVHAMCLAEALVAAGHDATLYALGKPGAEIYRTPACPVELIPAAAAPTDPDALIRQRIGEFAAGFRSFARRHDIFHAQDCLAANALLAVRSPGMGPIVRTVHHIEHFESPYLAECQRRSICGADAILSVSHVTQANVLAEFGRKSMIVQNGVDHARFVARRIDVEERLRRLYAVQPGDATILSVGGVEPRKNAILALRAVARTYAVIPRVRWILAGEHGIWDHSAYVARFEEELGKLPPDLRGRVMRAGTLPEEEMTSLYAMSDMLLCPSREEGFGLCVLEAMAAGTAVVVPGRPPFTEYLDESCAALVDSASIDSVSDGLSSLVVDPRRRHALADSARQRSLRFTWSESASRHLSHYVTVIDGWREDANDVTHERSIHA